MPKNLKRGLQIGGLTLLYIGWLVRWLFRARTNSRPTSEGLVVGYIRQSSTRFLGNPDEYDMNSPDRQRANILEAAKKYNLARPRIFQDVKGHKSGADVSKRTDWQLVDALIKAGKVRVLILNDLSRAHRKGWRIGELIEWLEKNKVRLILAAPGREVDVSSLMGKMFLLFVAMIDEYYVIDASIRQHDNVNRKRNQGQSLAMPPFGSVRKEGFLRQTKRGAWLLSDGQHVAGVAGEPPPEAEAIWRGYAECALKMMRLYTQRERLGYGRIALHLNQEGWCFRDQQHRPRLIDRDDVRRVIASWPKYAGIVIIGSAKARKAKDNLALLASAPADRNVFPISLLRKVAVAQETRTRQRRGTTLVEKAFPYFPFLYCAQCEQRALNLAQPSVHRRLTGSKGRYLHAAGIPCACTNRSIPHVIVNEAIGELLERFSFHTHLLTLMHNLALPFVMSATLDATNLEARRRIAKKKAETRLRNFLGMYQDGEIDRDTYEAKCEPHLEKLAKLKKEVRQARLQPAELPLTAGIEQLTQLAALWQLATDAERRVLGRLIFEAVIVDFDTRQITAYRLNPWLQTLLEISERD